MGITMDFAATSGSTKKILRDYNDAHQYEAREETVYPN